MTAQFQFFQSLPDKKADFVKKKPVEHGVIPGNITMTNDTQPFTEGMYLQSN